MKILRLTHGESAALKKTTDLLRDAAKHSDILPLSDDLKRDLRSAVRKIEEM